MIVEDTSDQGGGEFVILLLSFLVFRHSRFGARTHVSLQEDGPECVFSCQLSRGEICVANLKAPLPMVRVWTGF